MEVDLHSAASSVDSRHSSPFQLTAPSLPSTSYPTQLVDRKRRRSVQSFTGHLSPSLDYVDGESNAIEREDDNDRGGPAKRRHTTHASIHEAAHQYTALGSAYDSSSNAFEAEYAVDSPMHSLSLASPSPELQDRSTQLDVDMGESNSPTTLTQHPKTMTTFIPRQLKTTSLLRSSFTSTAPLIPSPLYHSERFQSSSTASNSDGGNPTSSQSTSSEDVMARKDMTSTQLDNQSSSCDSPSSSQARRSIQHNNKMRDSPLQIARTPSPSPLPLSPSTSQEEEERKLHYSPGLSQSTFPGGKHMLRYTMGYREDCVSCQRKTPGHYGHVLHR